MLNKISTSTLNTLGKRVERLLYFGSALLFLCFIELYFISATVNANSENSTNLQQFIVKFESRLSELQSSFQEPKIANKELQSDSQLSKRIAENRKLLGLGVAEATAKNVNNYPDLLREVVESASLISKLPDDTIRQLIDVNKPPEVLLNSMRERLKKRKDMPVNIWGIETPLAVTFQYGSVQYQIPISFIAKTLLIALVPLLIGWLGSLYMTRQRELFNLRGLQDFKDAFPHIINILPIIVSSVPVFNSLRINNRKSLKKELKSNSINRIFYSILRSVVLLLFALPMVLILGYGILEIIIKNFDSTLIESGFALVCLLWLGIQILLLIIQEWIMLWDKEYYA